MKKLLKLMNTNYYVLMVLLLVFSSCKTTKVISTGEVDAKLSSKSIIKAHYQNETNFKTLKGRLAIAYSDGESSQNVTVSLRMEKDNAIWMSAPFGVVKVYITPERVSFYNKLENEYFDGDFSYLSNLLGTEVDFSILQNLLTGQAIVDLRKEKYTLETTNKDYKLTPKVQAALYKTLFKVEPKNFKMAMQQLSQPREDRILQINYRNYQVIDKEIFPNKIMVEATSKEETTTIDLEYKNLELNAEVNFPYKIPNGFKEVEL